MIAQVLAHTPPWVYVLFAVLVAFGLQQTRSRTVAAVLAGPLPLGMIVLSLAGINSSFGLAPVPVAMWLSGLLAASFIGYRSFRDDRVTFDRSSRTFFIPGSWVPLLVIMAIFIAKYGFAVMRALDAEMVTNTAFVAGLSLAYGCFSGYFSSRAANLIVKARSA